MLTIALVTIALVLAGRTFMRAERSSPSEVLRDVQARFATGTADGRLLVRELAIVLDDPRSIDDDQLLAELLLCRSLVHDSLGDTTSAREDLERVLSLYRRGDAELELRAAALEAKMELVPEALARARRVVAREPANAEAWRVIGSLERRLAQELRSRAGALASQYLIEADALEAAGLLRELCARDPADRTRRSLADDLRETVPAGEVDLVKQLLDDADDASKHNRAARKALSRAMGLAPHPDSALELIRLLTEGGRADLAADLAAAARLDGATFADPRVLGATLDALGELGHLQRAYSVIQSWPWRASSPSRDLAEHALRLLFEGGAMRASGGPLAALRRTQDPGASLVASFYQAVQISAKALEVRESEALGRALQAWSSFLETPETFQPVPGARALAYASRAKVRGALGDTKGERQDLLRALTPPELVSEDAWFSRITGEDFARMSTLSSEARNAGYRGAEERWTRAMSAMPERTAEFEQRWLELGDLSLQRDAGYSFRQVFASAGNSGSPWPTIDVGPATLYRVALEHLSRGNQEGAAAVARRLVDQYPGLVPAWDALIEAQLQRGSRHQVLVDLLNRLSLTGPDGGTTAFLERYGKENLAPSQRLEWMRLDPAGFGRQAIARTQLDRGQVKAALRALGPDPALVGSDEGEEGHQEHEQEQEQEHSDEEGEDDGGQDAGPQPEVERPEEPLELRLLRVEALVAAGRQADALRSLHALDPRVRMSSGALGLELKARLLSPGAGGATRGLIEHYAALLAGDEPPTELALESVYTLLDRGLTGPAGVLLDALDSRAETRGGPMLEAMFQQRILAGDRDGALETLERAEAFIGDGSIELRRLVLRIDERAWRGLPEETRGVRAALGDGVDPWLDAALALLEERLEAGVELARAGLELNRRSPQWALLSAIAGDLGAQPARMPPNLGGPGRGQLGRFLRGGDAIGRDPREILGALIAVERAHLASMTESTALELVEREAGTLWPAWLRARALEMRALEGQAAPSLARVSLARDAYADLARKFPDFGPAWAGWERTLAPATGNPWPPIRVALRAARFAAKIGGNDPLERTVDEACALSQGDDVPAAATLLQRALGKLKGADPDKLQLLAHFYLATGNYPRALAALDAALPRRSTASDDRVVRQVVETLAAGSAPGVAKQQRLGTARVEAALEQLIKRFPRDPLPALAHARLRAESEKRNPALVADLVAHAFEELRERTSGTTLEDLRPEAPAEWGALLLDLAPEAAETAMLEDLALRPGDLTLWRLLTEAIAAQGHTADARALYRALTVMSNDPATHHAYAWFLLERGATRDEIQAEIMAAAQAGPNPALKDRALFVSAVAELRYANRPRLGAILTRMEALWRRRAEVRGVPMLMLGRSYVSALLQRRTNKDRRQAQKVLVELGRQRELDPYLPEVASAIMGICRALPDAQPESKRKPREAGDKGVEEGAKAQASPERE
jgi:tetratricopeptide (TPR) repeat protein